VAKSQQRGNRQVKKPKTEKIKVIATVPSRKATSLGQLPFRGHFLGMHSSRWYWAVRYSCSEWNSIQRPRSANWVSKKRLLSLASAVRDDGQPAHHDRSSCGRFALPVSRLVSELRAFVPIAFRHGPRCAAVGSLQPSCAPSTQGREWRQAKTKGGHRHDGDRSRWRVNAAYLLIDQGHEGTPKSRHQDARGRFDNQVDRPGDPCLR
jgi:hypothetical protein